MHSAFPVVDRQRDPGDGVEYCFRRGRYVDSQTLRSVKTIMFVKRWLRKVVPFRTLSIAIEGLGRGGGGGCAHEASGSLIPICAGLQRS